MSMFDALRNMKGRVPWLATAREESMQAPSPPMTVLQEMEELVRLAGVTGAVVDRQSSTWAAVSHWAATELLETFAKLESVDDTKAAARWARAKTLRELLAMDARPQVVKLEDQAPYIP